uniref:BTB domain-containing protein n=1 Tax=Glossina brevipalpis TaxID=37001 RepID=A0A1A9X097_9MUSC
MAAKCIDEFKPITEKECRNSDYSNTFLDHLNKMRINQKVSGELRNTLFKLICHYPTLQRCDFSLEVEGEIIHVHKLALEIASPYFDAMFESNMKEAREGVVRLEDMDVNAVKALVGYVYSGDITLTEANVEALFSASDLFQIEWVKTQCDEFLKRNMNSRNCFRIQRFADLHSLKELYDCTHKYILKHFDDLLDEEGLLLLPFEKVCKVYKSSLITKVVAHNLEF